MKIELTQEIVQEFLDYNPETGVFIWKNRSGTGTGRLNGNVAIAHEHANGYYVGIIFGVQVRSHRIAWLHYYGYWPGIIDHINGDKRDNSIANLRDTTRELNARNCIHKTRKYPTGVYKRGDSWRVAVGSEVSSFKCYDEAIAWRTERCKALGYTERRT